MTFFIGRLGERAFWLQTATIAVLAISLVKPCSATPDQRFDVATFCCNCSPPDEFCQTHLDHLNWVSANGHYIAMGTDTHRADLVAKGNALAAYHNDLNTNWTLKTATEKADEVYQYVQSNFTNTGAAPTWVIMNEISGGTWPGNQTYRTWVVDVAHRLHVTYGFNVIMYSPFPNPGANSADWTLLAADAYIGVENYLSGSEILAQNFSVSWCQSQYQSSMNSYMARGVPAAKIFLGEDFQQTVAGTGWGRDGVSAADWNAAINARSTGARNVGFAGYLTYAWGKNNMGVSDAEMTSFEDTYAAQALPVPVVVSSINAE